MANYFLFIFQLFIIECYSHTWLDCVSLTDLSSTNVNQVVENCAGFPRGYTSRAVNPDGSMYKIEGITEEQWEVTSACSFSDTAYSAEFPRLTAPAGSTHTLVYLPNGHTEWHLLDGQPNPPPNGPKNVWVKWTGTPGTEFSTMLEVSEGEDFVESIQFDTPCHDRETGAELDSSGGVCTMDYTIPANLQPGIYTFVWWWPFDFAGDSVIEEYVSCWDIEVTNNEFTGETQKTTAKATTSQQATSQEITSEISSKNTVKTEDIEILEKLTVSEDAMVKSGEFSTTNFGSEPHNRVLYTNGEYSIESYLKWDLSDFPEGYDCVFSIKSDGSDFDLKLGLIEEDDWSEDTLTWENKPTDSQFIGSMIGESGLLSFDLGDICESQKILDGFLTLRMYKDSGDSTEYLYFSLDSGALTKPTLGIFESLESSSDEKTSSKSEAASKSQEQETSQNQDTFENSETTSQGIELVDVEGDSIAESEAVTLICNLFLFVVTFLF